MVKLILKPSSNLYQYVPRSSWAVYNLLSACTACQNQANSIKPYVTSLFLKHNCLTFDRSWAYVTISSECKDFVSKKYEATHHVEIRRSALKQGVFSP